MTSDPSLTRPDCQQGKGGYTHAQVYHIQGVEAVQYLWAVVCLAADLTEFTEDGENHLHGVIAQRADVAHQLIEIAAQGARGVSLKLQP